MSAVLHGHGASRAASANGGLVLVLAAVAVLGWWAWHAWRHPYGRCWWCGGSGRTGGSSRKRFGDCGRCGGTELKACHKSVVVRPSGPGCLIGPLDGLDLVGQLHQAPAVFTADRGRLGDS